MIVLDACAAIAICFNSDEGNALTQLMYTDEQVIAPSLYKEEVTNAFWKFARAESMTRKEAIAQIEKAISLVDEFHDMEEYCAEALTEALRLNHSVYDLYYPLLARRHGATLFTLDSKLEKLCDECGVDCVRTIELP